MKSSINFIESYFGQKLDGKAAQSIGSKLSTREWIEFCKSYWENSELDLTALYFSEKPRDKTRLYIEPRLRNAFDDTVIKNFSASPLIGYSHLRITQDAPTADDVAVMLNPLKKHLLTSDQIFLPDGLLSSLDFVGEDAAKLGVNKVLGRSIVPQTEAAIKKWLFVLAHIRPLLKDNSIIFVPYHQMPSFWGGANSKALSVIKKSLRFTDDGQGVNANIDNDAILSAILSARFFDLDAVLPDRKSFEYASQFSFHEKTMGSVSDTIELSFKSLMPEEGISIKELVSIRKNEEIFSIVKHLSRDCKSYIENNLGNDASKEAVTRLSRAYLEDSLADHGKSSILKNIGECPNKSVASSIFVALCTMPLDFGAALIASLATNPSLLREGEKAFDKTHKAHARLLRLFS